MGLDVSHDAFSGAYSAFNRFRQTVVKAAGGSFPPHDDRTLDDGLIYYGKTWGVGEKEGLDVFISHSDCDGEIEPEMCSKVADDLEGLLPEIEKLDNGGSGHIQSRGGFVAVTKRFIQGCRDASESNETLDFM